MGPCDSFPDNAAQDAASARLTILTSTVIILRVTVTREGGGGGGTVTPFDRYSDCSVGCVAVLSHPGLTELRWRRVWHHACRLDI